MRWMLGLIALVAQAQNPLARPDPFVGLFERQNVALDLKGASGKYKGTLKVQGQSYAASVSSSGASGTGTFAVNGQEYRFHDSDI